MKHIHLSAPVKARHSIAINADIEKIWQLLTEIENWPAWNSSISRAILDGPVAPSTTFRWKSGPSKMTCKIHTCSKDKVFGWTGSFLGIGAVHNWHLSQQRGSVVVTTEESMEGILANLLPGMLQKQLDSGLKQWLSELKTTAET